jgi:predicted MFS family arabinose efflux permease
MRPKLDLSSAPFERTIDAMNAIASTPGARRLFVLSLVARLPLPMLSIGLLVHTQHLTGSYAAAGIVAGVYAVALGAGGPLLGRLVDGRGQTPVLVVSAVAEAVLLLAVALVPAGAAPAAVIVLAAGIGVAGPPAGACLRSLLPRLLPDSGALHAAYAFEATAVELTWIVGPPAGLALGALWSTGAALAVAGLVLLAGTVAFAVQPATRAWRPVENEAPRPRGGSLRVPAMQVLVVVLIGVGALFGASEVGVAAAADALGSPGLAGPLLGLWGAGSLVGGLVATRLGGGARGVTGLMLLLGALCAGHLALAAAAASAVTLAVALLIAGTAIAPSYATVYAIVDRVAPEGTATEAFAWLGTAVAIGASIGAAGAGAAADHAGPAAAFVLAGGAGALGLIAMAVGGRPLAEPAVAVAAAA